MGPSVVDFAVTKQRCVSLDRRVVTVSAGLSTWLRVDHSPSSGWANRRTQRCFRRETCKPRFRLVSRARSHDAVALSAMVDLLWHLLPSVSSTRKSRLGKVTAR